MCWLRECEYRQVNSRWITRGKSSQKAPSCIIREWKCKCGGVYEKKEKWQRGRLLNIATSLNDIVELFGFHRLYCGWLGRHSHGLVISNLVTVTHIFLTDETGPHWKIHVRKKKPVWSSARWDKAEHQVRCNYGDYRASFPFIFHGGNKVNAIGLLALFLPFGYSLLLTMNIMLLIRQLMKADYQPINIHVGSNGLWLLSLRQSHWRVFREVYSFIPITI